MTKKLRPVELRKRTKMDANGQTTSNQYPISGEPLTPVCDPFTRHLKALKNDQKPPESAPELR